MKLYGVTTSYNYEKLIPYVMPYVCRLGYDKLVVYDDHSTDKTVELLSQYDFIEIRNFSEEKLTTSVDFETRKQKHFLNFYSEAFKEAYKTGELTFMTVTDFDEVIYFSNFGGTFKSVVEWLYGSEGYNCFAGRIVNLLPPSPMMNLEPQLSKNTLVHTINGIRGRLWPYEGMKPVLFAVNDVYYYSICRGNHYATFHTFDNKPIKNFDDTGCMHTFHLKYINKDFFIEREKAYEGKKTAFGCDEDLSMDIYINSMYASSFPLENYFCSKQLNAIPSNYEGIKHIKQ